MLRLSEMLVDIARDLYLSDPEADLSPRDVEVFCPSCAEKMRRNGYRSVKAGVIRDVIEERAEGRGDG